MIRGIQWLFWMVVLIATFGGRMETFARQPTTAPVRDYRTAAIALRTDLPKEEAEALLQRLSALLDTISKYWGRKPSGVMDCHVARDIEQWPESVRDAMDPAGLEAIRAGSGLCLSTTIYRGNRFIAKAVVYATAEPGLVQHELVHAYCAHTFGQTGPLWYAEGMAERGQYWGADEPGLQADWHALRHLNTTPERTIARIIGNNQVGDWRDYADRWSLCVFLDYHPAYSAAFRNWGVALLQGRDVRLHQVYPGVSADRLAFEYRLFRQQVDRGYDVRRWAWDWNARFESLPESGRVIASRIEAARGWQASGVIARPDQDVYYRASGQWAVSEEEVSVCTADGLASGQGRLVGVVLGEGLGLSDEFELGASGKWTPTAAGRIYLRCRERHGAISDNRGHVVFQARAVPLTEPAAVR